MEGGKREPFGNDPEGGGSGNLDDGWESSKSGGITSLLASVRLKRWAPFLAVGVGMLFVGLLLGATLFGGGDPPAGAQRPPANCPDAAKGVLGAKVEPAAEAKPTPAPTEASAASPTGSAAPTKRSRADVRSRASSGARATTGGEGGHF